MFTKEKIIQITENLALTDKGRIFSYFKNAKGKDEWWEVELPDFGNKSALSAIPKGKTTFYEPITPQEKWDNAKTINDLL
jgi:hypothetical protein